MDKYFFFTDKDGQDRIFHARPPIFMAVVKDHYSQQDGQLSSNSFELHDKNLRIYLVESYQEALDSKISFNLNKAIKSYTHWKTKQNENN
ncbi:MAG: hypothetical protein AAFO07_04215 [Bacteroidota bacterium]